MEIRNFLAELKEQLNNTEDMANSYEFRIADLRDQLATAEKNLESCQTKLTALRMAVEGLEFLDAPSDAATVADQAEPQEVTRHGHVHSRKPKMIIQLNANGNQIGCWSSINKCAKAMGWTTTGVRKYIETVSHEKQIKLRGFVLTFAE